MPLQDQDAPAYRISLPLRLSVKLLVLPSGLEKMPAHPPLQKALFFPSEPVPLLLTPHLKMQMEPSSVVHFLQSV